MDKKERPLSKIEGILLDIGHNRFPKHPLKVRVWDASGTITYFCEKCHRDHYVDLSEEEKQTLSDVNYPKKERGPPYTL
ncbi:hypothetical protein J4465_02470 [Candidatus Pacearchaeota archaeon]|nr:hypothetical protein [Candidatus Pacearchaeota archaeon]